MPRRSRVFSAIRHVALTVSFLSAAQAKVWPGERWPVRTLQEEGIERAAIDALVEDMEGGKYGLMDHFLLIRNGYVLLDRHFERDYQTLSARRDPVDQQYDYDHPKWHPYRDGTALHTLQSVTKSITSILVGMAIDEGSIPGGVASRAMSFFERYEPDLSDVRKRNMTLEDLLTMRSGIDWNEMLPYSNPENSCIRLEASQEWIRFVLERPMKYEPGTVFNYNSGASVLLGKVVREATGKRIDAYAREKLFGPLGIQQVYWKITPDEEVDTEGGLYLTAQDLARIGYLFLRGGLWKGKRIVSEEWVRQSTQPVIPDVWPKNQRQDHGYGYQWWVPPRAKGEARMFSARGFGGQFLFVVPDYDLVVVMNAWNIHTRPELDSERAVAERILPATAR